MTSEQQATESSSKDGIDIFEALGILSSRTGDDHDHSHAGECHHHVPEGGTNMGQSIDLVSTAEGDAQDIMKSMESQKQELAEERTKRRAEIQTTLESLTTRELLASVMDVQTARVATYREYDEGLKVILATSNLTNYPAICAKATASFSILSESVKAIQDVLLQEKHGNRKDLVTIVSALQTQEREKLNVTAALHLEKIREQNEVSRGDERASDLLKEGVVTLSKRVTACVMAINELLEEIRYAMAEEE